MNEFFKTTSIFIAVLLFAIVSAVMLGSIYAGETGNIALIPIKGEITTEDSMFADTASSSTIVSNIEDADANPEIQAILFEIDSPGGTIIATREIAAAVKATTKPTVCWLREVAASGAYWIASNCDKIVADPYTITGSIGVSGSYLELSGFFEKYGVGYVRVVGGEQKDIGTPYREPTDTEKAILQKMVDEIHVVFIEEVKTNRNLTDDQMTELQKAGVFLGKDAKEMGLIDVLGSKKEAVDAITNLTGITEASYLTYETTPSFSELMAGFFGQSMAKQFMSNQLTLKS
jgi:protease-4